MTVNIDSWIKTVVKKLKCCFEKRILFIGLQGSHNRGEATESSDIDLVVILDKLDFEDLKRYKKIIEAMPDNEKACGFISGKKELANWSKSDLFQFWYDTKAIFGDLNTIIAPPEIEDIKTAIKTGSENLYHSACHFFLHNQNIKDFLPDLYKMTFFILQSEYFIKNNKYIPTKKDLLPLLKNSDHEILEICINKKFQEAGESQIETFYSKLINWSSSKIQK